MTITSSLWPFKEATRLTSQMEKKGKKTPLLETGFGPSGLPHIGTFAEVARTTYVAKAYKEITGITPKLLVFSDDKDALRAVPTNVPNQDMLKDYIGQSLTNIPDPYGMFNSFASHNNAMLQRFLDECGFDYEFASSTEYYASGRFNDALIKMARHHQDIIDIVSPTLGDERRATWSPFMPLHPITKQVMMVPVEVNADGTMVSWDMPDNMQIEGMPISRVHTPVTDGHCKIQWKADWALRWFALDVDYEMCGKDLRDSVTLSSRICRKLGGLPPVNMIYELFLDENGHKFSKKIGNGISVEDWSRYAPLASMENFIFKNPQTAKKVFISAVPKSFDECIASLEDSNNPEKSAFFVNDRLPEVVKALPMSYDMLLNIVDAGDIRDSEALMRIIIAQNPYGFKEIEAIRFMAPKVIQYYIDVMSLNKNKRKASLNEVIAIQDLYYTLKEAGENLSGDEYQTLVFEVGKRHYEKSELRQWFKALYEILFGYESGPRLGHFIHHYGYNEFLKMLFSHF